MKWRNWLAAWGLDSLKINLKFLEMTWKPQDEDRKAAWDLYIELLTRITTQPLAREHGDEKVALDSVYAIFPLTRGILRAHGAGCGEFAKLAIPVLNQIVRPFTSKWHRLSIGGAFQNEHRCTQFRKELASLQVELRHYTQALAKMANVEDLTKLEEG